MNAILEALGPDKDATIEEVRRSLAGQGLFFGFGTIQRFFARHTITRKKERERLGARIAGGALPKEKPGLQRWDRSVRYALIVSLRAPGAEIDIYTPIAIQLGIEVPAT
ncbi:hypothetical protein C8J35_11524 [Rhizobium sp. PP-F2F-G38]|nr:hypothetical protein C8J37_12727 [Rhizobium sp. PP-WC-1G-195]PYE93255.1 hypothetical protein C8J35_11524 [Rhizobium sp. PP-F2F-G38]TCP73974.1 hypothetical protein C8J31_1503 [Rhizobium sp. PP-CC-2G-626]TCQ16178.1 hypothetical protein C8J33_11711 [Rhizobium sp. PP-CC-3G-465]